MLTTVRNSDDVAASKGLLTATAGNGNSAFFEAVQMGDMELVEFLHARGASTNVLGIPNTRDMPPM